MSVKLPITGGCVCGAVRYECHAAPLMMLKCHCRDCQQISGGPYTPAVIFPLQAFKVTKGEIRHYGTPSLGGGHNLRGFCPQCGSRLTGAENPQKGIIGVVASSLDDPCLFKPQMDIFTADAQPWDLMDPALPRHPQQFHKK
jgi:hypothetical protein